MISSWGLPNTRKPRERNRGTLKGWNRGPPSQLPSPTPPFVRESMRSAQRHKPQQCLSRCVASGNPAAEMDPRVMLIYEPRGSQRGDHAPHFVPHGSHKPECCGPGTCMHQKVLRPWPPPHGLSFIPLRFTFWEPRAAVPSVAALTLRHRPFPCVLYQKPASAAPAPG